LNKYQDKSVKSVRSRVTNISEHLEQALEITDFIEMLMDHITAKYEDAVFYDFSATDDVKIYGDFFYKRDVAEIEQALQHTPPRGSGHPRNIGPFSSG
jgi:lipoate-protein ligase A